MTVTEIVFVVFCHKTHSRFVCANKQQHLGNAYLSQFLTWVNTVVLMNCLFFLTRFYTKAFFVIYKFCVEHLFCFIEILWTEAISCAVFTVVLWELYILAIFDIIYSNNEFCVYAIIHGFSFTATIAVQIISSDLLNNTMRHTIVISFNNETQQ